VLSEPVQTLDLAGAQPATAALDAEGIDVSESIELPADGGPGACWTWADVGQGHPQARRPGPSGVGWRWRLIWYRARRRAC